MLEKIKIHAVPNAPKSECVGEYLDSIKIKIGAPAVDGKANAELVKYLSKTLGITKGAITIKCGENGREKIVEIDAPFPVKTALLATCRK